MVAHITGITDATSAGTGGGATNLNLIVPILEMPVADVLAFW